MALLAAIALSGCGSFGPIDQHGKAIATDQLGKYALVSVEEGFINSVDGEPAPLMVRELNVLPGRHIIKFNDRYCDLTHEISVMESYRYKLPTNCQKGKYGISVSKRDDPSNKEIEWLESTATDHRSIYGNVAYIYYIGHAEKLAKLEKNWQLEVTRLAEERAEKERVLAEQRARAERIAQLKAGTIKPMNIKDAYLYFDNEIHRLSQLMASPLLKPNNAIFGGRVTLDAEENAGVLRARADSDSLQSVIDTPFQTIDENTVNAGFMRQLQASVTGNGMQHDSGRYYTQLKLNEKSVNFSENTMRIGSAVWVLGRYVANRKYKTVSGTERTMPILEVLYISE